MVECQTAAVEVPVKKKLPIVLGLSTENMKILTFVDFQAPHSCGKPYKPSL